MLSVHVRECGERGDGTCGWCTQRQMSLDMYGAHQVSASAVSDTQPLLCFDLALASQARLLRLLPIIRPS